MNESMTTAPLHTPAPPIPDETPEQSLVPPHLAESIDRLVHATLARYTLGVSPAVLMLAYFDWAVHLALAPGKQLRLTDKAVRKAARLARHVGQCLAGATPAPCIEPLHTDHRFASPAWQRWPWNVSYQSFLLTQQWWHNATTDVRGVDRQHEHMVNFAARQVLDMCSPSNGLLTNPDLLAATAASAGGNLVRGFKNWLDDAQALASGLPAPQQQRLLPGQELALTPGAVVYRNALMELIQYAPATATVQAEPLLIVPAWIMKFYVLDLRPENSLIRYLVDAGHTVFCISWKNPGPDDRDRSMDDYRRMGVMDALAVIGDLLPARRVHAIGYCLGGTLLAIAAAAMARDGDERLATLTLLAAQVDFSEAGELMTFINEDQVAYLEDMMWEQGYLDTRQMAGAFQLLRSNDLIWSRMVREYLLGERDTMTDLMSWNADATRMPYKMHSQYLRRLFLDNAFVLGQYRVEGRAVSVTDIAVPICAVGTEKDHVAPWRSVYKLHLHADSSEVTFILTQGGHNAGIVSEPGHPGRHYQISTRHEGDHYLEPQAWFEATPVVDGSWWTAFVAFLAAHSSGRVAPPSLGSTRHPPLIDAPGQYVLQR